MEIYNTKLKILYKIIAILLCIIFILFKNTYLVIATSEPQVRALSAVVLNEKNNCVLWEKNANEVRAMASLTKIMTAIVTLENAFLDDVFEVSDYAASMPETKLFFKSGEKYKVKDLLYAIMLKSANDAAVVLAEGVAGSNEAFCEMMNDKARSIGCENTNFISPNGLDNGDKSHYTTAKEMALIASYALKNPTFKNIIKTQQMEIADVSKKRKFVLNNSNRLLNTAGVGGIKTGFTNLAGQCFAGFYEDKEKSYITIVLASGWGKVGKEAKWSDTTKLMNYINDNFEERIVINQNQEIIRDIFIEKSYNQKIKLYAAEELKNLMDKKEKIKNAKADVYIYDNIKAPLNKGARVGEAVITINGQKVGTVEVFTSKEVIERNLKNSINKIKNMMIYKYKLS